MRVASVIPGPRTIVQASINNNNTITPNTAFTDLLRLTGVNIHGSPVRISATGSVILTGTTNTVRTVFLRLVHGVGAGVTLAGGAFSLNNDEAATSLSTFFALNFIILSPAVLATDEFALQWSTGANATANINGTDRNVGGADLNVEELVSPTVSIGPSADTLVLDSRMATDPVNLLSNIGNSFALALGIDPNIQVVDFSLAGGGAGNVYMFDVIYRLPQLVEDVAYPRLADQLLGLGFGPERVTMVNSSIRWLNDFPAALLNIWTEACSGDGAEWITLYMFNPNDQPPGPTLLEARSSAPRESGPFLLDVSQIQPLPGGLAGMRVVSASDTIRAPSPKPAQPSAPQRFEASPRKG